MGRPSDPSNLLTGVQLVSRLVSTTNHQPLYQEVILPRSNVLFACCPTQLLLLKLGLVLTISSILCMPSVLSFTGMSEKVWKEVTMKENIKLSSQNSSERKKTRKNFFTNEKSF